MNIINAAAYARYSSDNQREESLSAQLNAIKDYCQKKGYILTNVYTDEAKTATNDHRKGFQQMITDSELKLFNVVVVHKFDRFARNRYDSASYKRKLKINKVRLESVLEQLDDSPESVILESVLEGMAEYYSKNLAREVRKGLLENAKAGIHNGGRTPYGLKVNPITRKYEIDETRYKAVQMYFNGVAAGIPLAEIARRINAEGFRTYTGDKFKVTSFDTWANNRKYKGDYAWDVATKKDAEGKRNSHAKKPIEEQTIIPGVIPAIIPTELWERVNALMKERQRTGGSMTAKETYLLSGKITCGSCGANYFGEGYNSRGRHYAYYKCSGKCGNNGVDKYKLEKMISEMLEKTCFSEEGMEEIKDNVKKLYADRKKNIDSEIAPIKNEIRKLELKIDNWLELIGEGTPDKRLFAQKVSEANERKTLLESQLTKMNVIASSQTIDEAILIKVLKAKKDQLLSSNEEDRKQVFKEYVDKVVINTVNDQTIIELCVRCFNGGGEGICTPVSKSCHKSVYACILYFKFRQS
ncbi:Recombinase [Desulfosporosinus sp. BG]|nr:Recombinase [Desulfosporosinus sp. BG]